MSGEVDMSQFFRRGTTPIAIRLFSQKDMWCTTTETTAFIIRGSSVVRAFREPPSSYSGPDQINCLLSLGLK